MRIVSSFGYDPRDHGAACDVCPLRKERQGKPVPPEWNGGGSPLALVVGANPGPEEVKKGAPFVGPAGLELMRALGSVGIRRSQVAITNSILCCPPGPPRGALERFMHGLQKENKERAEEGIPQIPTPMECCRPRLFREIEALPNVVGLGGAAMHAITGRPTKILETRGGPRSVDADPGSTPPRPAFRLLPTLHPSFILSSRRWAGAFRSDLGRAFRWFTSGLAWKDPSVLYRPSPVQLERFLALIREDPFSVYDVETFPGFRAQDHFDPLFDRLKCIGIGVGRGLACVVPFRSIEQESLSFYTAEEKIQIVTILKHYLTSPLWKKAGWNSNYYDRMVIEERIGVTPFPTLDGIGLSKLASPELPHNLGFAGSIYTDVDNWKAGHVATDAKTDRQLWDYNAKDTVVTAMAIPRLAEVCQERGQRHLLRPFMRIQGFCVDLHRNGMWVNQEIRRAWDRKLLWQAKTQESKIRELAGKPKLNPGSYPQLGDLLFNKLGVAPHHYSEKTGEPSTDDDSLRAFLSETWGLDPKRRALVTAIRNFRRVTKRRGVVVRLRPITDGDYQEPFLIDLEETEEEREERERRQARGKSAKAPGLCLLDGRVHADYNAGGTVGWRLSSSGPNMQNLEDKLRDIFEAAPGYVLVACDEAQLELRMVAGLAGCKYYLDAFRSGADPHKNLCVDTFADRFLQADPPQQKKLRRSVKELTYSCAARGTRIVTTGIEGDRAIEELRPGEDWTFTWDGEKCAPARIVNKWCRGLRECVRVTFEWPGHQESEIFTTDHRFLLLGGTYREAGDLAPSDRLMPFFRWRSGAYRMIDRYNDNGREAEHRIVAGLEPGDPRMVHHYDEIGTNNHPDNLVPMGAHEHLSKHWDEERRVKQREINAALWASGIGEKLAAGRRASASWRAANAENYTKMRAGLDRARAEGKVKGWTFSRLEELRDKIGVLPDREIADMLGVTRQAVYYFRKTRGIPIAPKRNHAVVSIEPVGKLEVWDIEVDHPAHNFALASGIFVHNSLYWAGNETKLEIVTSAEDENEELIFPDFTLREVGAFTDSWHRRCPEIAAWWESILAEWKTQHFLAEPILGLKCDFLDGEDRTKLVNLKPQSGGSALTHLATFRVMDSGELPKLSAKFVQQGHDSIVFELPADHGPWKTETDPATGKVTETWCAPGCQCRASRLARLLEECMKASGKPYGLDVDFIGEAKVGRSWKGV